MEVVCLILGPMLASQPCLHLLSFFDFYYSCFNFFFSEWCECFFVDCRNTI